MTTKDIFCREIMLRASQIAFIFYWISAVFAFVVGAFYLGASLTLHSCRRIPTVRSAPESQKSIILLLAYAAKNCSAAPLWGTHSIA